MNIGIFGGTFNPIHNGHIIIAKKILEKLNIDKIIFMPNSIPPHKKDEDIVKGDDRYNMIKSAIKDEDNMEVSDFEIKKEGVSYTLKTLEYLNKNHNDDFYWIIGADMLLSFNKWYEFEKILSLAGLLTVYRPGFEKEKYERKIKELKGEYSAKILDIEIEPIDISSTEVREKIKTGKDVKALVPYSVWMYIIDNNLYRS